MPGLQADFWVKLNLVRGGRSYPWWPFLVSSWIHVLVIIFPVAVAPQPARTGETKTARIEARLVGWATATSQVAVEVREHTEAPVAGRDATARTEPVPAAPPLALVTKDRYFHSSEVDERAEPIELAPLVYPEEAYLRRLAGKVVLRLYLNETGSLDGIDIILSDPAGVFDQAAIDAVLASRFRPALLFSRPVKNVKTIEIAFDPLLDR